MKINVTGYSDYLIKTALNRS